MDSRTHWRFAFHLSWPTLWLTVLYGAIVLPPVALLVMFSDDKNMPFGFALFFIVLGTLMWKCVRAYIDDGMRIAPKPFVGLVLPLINGKAPTPERIENGRAPRKAAREMLRERFTAFSLAALLGSVIVSGLQQAWLIGLYLPLWLVIDVWFFRQMTDPKRKKKGAAAADDGLLGEFMAFDRWQDGRPARFVKIAVMWPAALFLALWICWPLLGGAITLPLSDGVESFLSETEEPAADKNGVYAILGLGDRDGDMHATGIKLAEMLKRGEAVPPLYVSQPDERQVCRTDFPPAEGETCLRLSETGPLLAANEALLAEYKELYAYDSFVWPRDLVTAAGTAYEDAYLQGLTNLGLLKIVSTVVMAKDGKAGEALDEWLAQMRFFAKLMAARQSLESYAATRHVYGEATLALPYILMKDPGLAKARIEDIRAAFAYLSPRDIDMVEIVRNETRIMSWSADRQVERVFKELPVLSAARMPAPARKFMQLAFAGSTTTLKGKLYWLMREMEQIIREDRMDMDVMRRRFEKIDRRYNTRGGKLLHGVADMAAPHIAAVVNLLIGYLPEAYAKTLFSLKDFNRQRMLRAWVEAQAAGIPPDGMGDFLKDKAPEISPDLTELDAGVPFYWDSAKSGICYDEKLPEGVTTPKVTHCLETGLFVE